MRFQGSGWRLLFRQVGLFRQHGHAWKVVCVAGGAAGAAAVYLPSMLLQQASESCIDVIMWCCEQVGDTTSVIDCSLGPYLVGEGTLPWVLAERGCNVRAMDLGHYRTMHYNPARKVVPHRRLKGSICFQVAATHNLLPTNIPRADWFVLLCTLQYLPVSVAASVVSQALEKSDRVLVAEFRQNTSFATLAMLYALPYGNHTNASTVDDVVKDPAMATTYVESQHRVGPFVCTVLTHKKPVATPVPTSLFPLSQIQERFGNAPRPRMLAAA